MKLLGIDPGYRRCGVAVATLVPGGARFDLVRVIETEPDDEAPKTADMRRRMQEIALELAALCDHEVIAICVEAGAPPFGKAQTQVVSGLGRARGLVDMLAAVMRLPVIEPSPAALKKLVAGANNATKEQVKDAMEARYPELASMWPRLKGNHEHAADAAASIVAGLGNEVVHEAKRRRGAA